LTTLLYCISSHGFGHAARACAVIEALWERAPELRCEIVSGVPGWFFEHSLGRPVPHDPMVIDFGLVQSDALREDTEATVRTLRDWLPFTEERLGPLVRRIEAPSVGAVVCDIAPLGIAAAERAGKPTVLV
jgi:predicted glycosyltransferase